MSKKQDIFFIVVIALMLIGTALINRAQAAPTITVRAQSAKPVKQALKTKRAKKSATQRSYVVKGVRYHPLASAKNFVQTGKASWYGPGFHGKKTSNGERYNMHALTAAHKTLPLGTVVRVSNLDNGKNVIVRINDRGPFHGKRVIDLSKAAAARLGFVKQGMAKVRVEALHGGRPALFKASADAEDYYADTDSTDALLYAADSSVVEAAQIEGTFAPATDNLPLFFSRQPAEAAAPVAQNSTPAAADKDIFFGNPAAPQAVPAAPKLRLSRNLARVI
ncbi:septal ring lytic transglycosylase RlpA family protein [Conchiformibius steedae]|nr:septal ring lytic transglycosylase RlpA family protein [Conchiformibius steedae]